MTRPAIVKGDEIVFVCVWGGGMVVVTDVVLSTEVITGFWWKIMKERTCLEDLSVDGMILQCVLQK